MNLPTAVRSVLSQYAGFSGRARRSEYWYFQLFGVVVGIVAAALDALIGSDLGGGTGIIGAVVSLGLLLPSLAVFWRRMHDTGRSGLWIFLGLIPFVGAIILIVFAVQDSQPGANRYGPSPKALAHR